MLHAPRPAFHPLSGGTGSLGAAVELLTGDAEPAGEGALAAAWVRELARDFDPARAGCLVLGTNSLSEGPFTLLDGNHRASASLLSRRDGAAEAGVLWPVVLASSSRPLAPW